MTPSQLADSANAPWTRTMVGFMRRLLSDRRGRLRGRGLAEPVLEAGRGDACVAARGEGVLVELRAEVAGVDVGHHPARIVVRAQDAPDELVEAELLGAPQLDDAVDAARSRRCRPVRRRRRRRLRAGRARAAGGPSSPSVLESAMRPMNSKNCVARRIVYGIGRGLHRLLLGELRAEVAAVREPVGADDRQRDVVPHPGRCLGGERCCGPRSGRSPSPPRRPSRARSTRRRRPARPRAPRPVPRR